MTSKYDIFNNSDFIPDGVELCDDDIILEISDCIINENIVAYRILGE